MVNREYKPKLEKPKFSFTFDNKKTKMRIDNFHDLANAEIICSYLELELCKRENVENKQKLLSDLRTAILEFNYFNIVHGIANIVNNLYFSNILFPRDFDINYYENTTNIVEKIFNCKKDKFEYAFNYYFIFELERCVWYEYRRNDKYQIHDDITFEAVYQFYLRHFESSKTALTNAIKAIIKILCEKNI